MLLSIILNSDYKENEKYTKMLIFNVFDPLMFSEMIWFETIVLNVKTVFNFA